MRGNREIHEELRAKYANKDFEESQFLKRLDVLIIEDHPLMQKQIAESFFKLNRTQKEYYFVLDIAFNCKEAYDRLSNVRNKKIYDLIILDIQLPQYPKENLYSGEDIAEWIKNNLTHPPKTIIVTCITEKHRIENLIKNINPNGLLVKEDISCKILLDAIKNSFEENPYYTQSVANFATKLLSTNLIIDTLDRRLLVELSCGAKIVELEELLPLSRSAIEKRKKILMDKFNIESNSVRELVLSAKSHGFI